ncbi:hypothetical protein FGO68_gene6141 [Halteria grandinella]|uniref:Uncharacterized protein n=1 Tax=Halteria grandinella TaxID=5974 RepID=A0A8J8SZP8_HALGN|nr:hypothetical protein FGO68_gene6141 [Halteria grandinella]
MVPLLSTPPVTEEQPRSLQAAVMQASLKPSDLAWMRLARSSWSLKCVGPFWLSEIYLTVQVQRDQALL